MTNKQRARAVKTAETVKEVIGEIVKALEDTGAVTYNEQTPEQERDACEQIQPMLYRLARALKVPDDFFKLR